MTIRSILLGIIFCLFASFVVIWGEMVTQWIQIGFLQLPPVCLALLLLLLVVNSLLKKMAPNWQLHRSQLVLIYCAMLIAAMLSSRGWLEMLVPMLISPAYFITSAEPWDKIYFGSLKQSLFPFNLKEGAGQFIAKRFFEGLRGGEHIHWMPWLKPLILWSGLGIVAFFTMLCLSALLGRQWREHEKLSFPLIQLPLFLLGEGNSFLRDKLTWVGILIPVFVFTLNGLHQLYPSLPELDTRFYLNQFFTTHPWNALYYMPMCTSFAGIGLFYLLPVEILFSLLLVYFFTRFCDVFFAYLGLPREFIHTSHPRIGYPIMGAYLALAALMLLAAARNLISDWRLRRYHNKGELMPLPVAFWGLCGGVVILIIWWWYFGMGLALAIYVVLTFIFVQCVIMSRGVAECGMIMTETAMEPHWALTPFLAKDSLSTSSISGLIFSNILFTRDLRGLAMTGFLDGTKLAAETNTS